MTTPKVPFLPTAPVFAEGHVNAEMPREPKVLRVAVWLCELCLAGAGGECHVPGCAMFLHSAPDLPVTHEVLP